MLKIAGVSPIFDGQSAAFIRRCCNKFSSKFHTPYPRVQEKSTISVASSIVALLVCIDVSFVQVSDELRAIIAD